MEQASQQVSSKREDEKSSPLEFDSHESVEIDEVEQENEPFKKTAERPKHMNAF